jgi:hypothetical protein
MLHLGANPLNIMPAASDDDGFAAVPNAARDLQTKCRNQPGDVIWHAFVIGDCESISAVVGSEKAS